MLPGMKHRTSVCVSPATDQSGGLGGGSSFKIGTLAWAMLGGKPTAAMTLTSPNTN